MKIALVLGLEMMIMMVTQPLLARDETLAVGRFMSATIEQSEKSLKIALEAPSQGLQLSAANTTRQLKELLPGQEFSSLVIPLMRIVKDENAETSARIVAAIALHGLHSAKGDFAISRTAEFTDNPRMKNTCSWLTYYQKLSKKPVHPDVSLFQRSIEQTAPEPLPEDVF